ncbi:hypothetical protein BD410DRAFT_794152 [Rickenella mellea]|uniref:Methyltransferase type 11 domain-containing protein n=1 Tax=Rickenella mellea TaxID=50990 RepID=A0A4Y7PSZ4_9AGAM|nr:hypothetical protein BD410DRAFT_794152 [Rickenella mellea]
MDLNEDADELDLMTYNLKSNTRSTPPPRDGAISPCTESDSLVSIAGSDDGVGYFREESGRVFHTLPGIPVLVPTDNAEMRRLNEDYFTMKLFLGKSYWGPVEEILAPAKDGHTLRAMDIVSQGPWLDDMSEQFPHVKWHGIQFVPNRRPYRENVVYEVYDISEGLRGADCSFDFIHSRLSGLFIKDRSRFLREVKRLLRPGGLFISGDYGPEFHTAEGSTPRGKLPCTTKIVEMFALGIRAQGLDPDGYTVTAERLRTFGGFEEINELNVRVPIGPWDTSSALQQDIGEHFREVIKLIAFSLKPIMYRVGLSQSDADEICQGFIQEIWDPRVKLYHPYCGVYAIKV